MTEKKKKSDSPLVSTPIKSLFHAEFDGNKSFMNFVFSGVNSVRDYSDKRLLIRFRGFSIRLTGEKLRLFVFEDGSLSLCGKILEVEFVYDRDL